jgi:hypothetical protein
MLRTSIAVDYRYAILGGTVHEAGFWSCIVVHITVKSGQVQITEQRGTFVMRGYRLLNMLIAAIALCGIASVGETGEQRIRVNSDGSVNIDQRSSSGSTQRIAVPGGVTVQDAQGHVQTGPGGVHITGAHGSIHVPGGVDIQTHSAPHREKSDGNQVRQNAQVNIDGNGGLRVISDAPDHHEEVTIGGPGDGIGIRRQESSTDDRADIPVPANSRVDGAGGAHVNTDASGNTTIRAGGAAIKVRDARPGTQDSVTIDSRGIRVNY